MGRSVGRRPRVATPASALAVGALTVVMLADLVVAGLAEHRGLQFSRLAEIVLFMSFGLVGVIVAWHQPRNPMGWVLLGVTFFLLLSSLGNAYAYIDYRVHGGRMPWGWLAVLVAPSWAPAIVLAGLAVMLFPDGRILARWWKPMLWAYLALGALWMGGAVAISLGALVGHHVSIDSSGGLSSLDNPTGPNAWWSSVQAVFFPVVAVCWLVWLAGQVLSYRRSSGERRLQLKWLLSGATVFIVAAVGLVLLNNPTGVLRVADGAAGVGTLALPVSIGFGILKFRLYDIDRIISRTVAYAVITGVLVGVYAGLVLVATQVLRFHGTVAVAVSTLVAAALFNPVRHRVQRAVDRRFNRARYDADRTVAAFAARLQDAVDLGTVRADLLGVVDGALEPTHLSLWITPAD